MKDTRDVFLVIGSGILVLCNIFWLIATLNPHMYDRNLAAITSGFAAFAWLTLFTAAMVNLFIKK